MRKVISGIIAIICIDIVFAAYMAMDWQTDVADAGSPRYLTDPGTVPTADLDKSQSAGISTEPPEPTSIENPDLTRTDNSPVHTIRRPSCKGQLYAAKLHLRGIKKEMRPPARVEFRDITILYAAYKPVEFKADKEFDASDRQDPLSSHQVKDQQVKAPRKAENRSFLDRVLPIVKKPYDWIKALGSKLY